jgi:small-conductance mechanosensitive channel
VNDYDRGKVNESALRIAIVKAFQDANIEIPFPQRNIHIRTAAAAPHMATTPDGVDGLELHKQRKGVVP